MTRRVRVVLASAHSFLLFVLLFSGCAQETRQAQAPVFAPSPQVKAMDEQQPTMPLNQWAVRLNRNIDPQDVADDLGLEIVEYYPETGLALFAGNIPLDDFDSDPRISTAEANDDIILSSPVEVTLGFHQGDLGPNGQAAQDGLEKLSLPSVHTKTRGAGVRVAILDTGADLDHTMLAPRLLIINGGALPASEGGNGEDDDGDGQIDEAYGHGTHIAGIIATVAPDATLIPIRVLNDDGWGTVFDLAVGMYMAMEINAHVVNMSLVLNDESPMIAAAIRELTEAGIRVVTAAGNDPAQSFYPATDPRTMAIAAVDEVDMLAPFSSFGPEIQVAAPGVDILSAYPDDEAALGSGTSMATGVASGSMALVIGLQQQTKYATALLCHTSAIMAPEWAVQHGRISPVGALKRLLRHQDDDIHASH